MEKLNTVLYRFVFSRHNSPLIIGICVGIALSLVQTPFLQSRCIRKDPLSSDDVVLSNIRDLRSNNLEDEELKDFEPNVQLDQNVEVNKKGKEKQSNNIIRPRYYSTELGMRDKLLVSVISTKESISNLGVAVNKTLNHLVDKIIFFLDGTGSQKFGLNIPIVGFKDSKPLMKIFRILSYINEKYLNDYDYFLFITDNTYVNGKRLMAMLQQISINQNVYMGVPILSQDSVYCSLENGIILSQSVMEVVGKELLWCIKNSLSELDSDNFGRCILHSSNLPCKSTYQIESFISNNLNEGVNFKTNVDNLDKNAVTVANVMKAPDIFYLHVYYLQEFIMKVKDEIGFLRNKIETTMTASSLNLSLPWPIGSPSSHSAPTRHDVISWETFNETHLFMPSDFENIKQLDGLDLMDIMSVVNASVSHLNANSLVQLHFEHINYGHRRYDPTRGMDYLISLNFKNSDGKLVNKRIEAYRGLTLPEITPMPYVTENTRVTILVFVEKEEVDDALKFLELLSTKAKMEQLSIMFCLLYSNGEKYLSSDDPFGILKSKASDFTKKYYSKQTRASYIHKTMSHGRPSDLALVDLALPDLEHDTIILVADTMAFYDSQFLNRVRMNTIKNWQVFSPIPFIQYHPSVVQNKASYEKREVNKNNGHYDKYYFKHMSFYIEDFKFAKSKLPNSPLKSEKDLLKMKSSPYEVTVYDVFMAVPTLHILRGVEPALILSYDSVHCPESEEPEDEKKKQQCLARQGLSLGPKTELSKIVLNHIDKKGT